MFPTSKEEGEFSRFHERKFSLEKIPKNFYFI